MATAAYLQAPIVANSTTGVASFNSSVSGNLSWTLTHTETGAVTASLFKQAFTGKTGVSAEYGGTYGNLTGNFTWRVWLNVSLGTVNNTTLWAEETGQAAFEITGPPAPTPTPTPIPPPPPPVAGDLRIVLLDPDPNRAHREVMRVSALVSALGANDSVKEVRAVIEKRDLRAAPANATVCDAVPTGWKLLAGGNGTWSAAWDLNDSESPMPPGLYTLYVRAASAAGLVACQPVTGLAVRSDTPTTTPAPGDAPAKAAPNVTVAAVSCGGSEDLKPKPCPMGIRGPPERGKIFYLDLSGKAPVAVCGPVRCDKFAAADRQSFKPDRDGEYCVRRVDAEGVLREKVKIIDSLADACWTVGQIVYGGGGRIAAGLSAAIVKPDDIPCTPRPGFWRTEPEQDPETGASAKKEYPEWVLRPGPWPETKTICKVESPVYWSVYIAHDCPLAQSVPGLVETSKTSPGDTGAAGSLRRGALYSRGTNPDGSLGKWGVSREFTVPLPCVGKYEAWTLGPEDDPDRDKWALAWTFEVARNPPFQWTIATAVAAILSAVGGVIGALVAASLYFSRSVTSWRQPGKSEIWKQEERSFQRVPADSVDYQPGGKPVALLYLYKRAKKKSELTGRRVRLHRIRLGFEEEWQDYPETVQRIGVVRQRYHSAGYNPERKVNEGLHQLPVPIQSDSDGEEFDVKVLSRDPARLPILEKEAINIATNELSRRRIRREQIRNAAHAREIAGADRGGSAVERGMEDSARDAGEGMPGEPGAGPQPSRKSPGEGGLF